MMDAGIEIQLNLSSFDPTKNSIRFDILQGRNGKLLDGLKCNHRRDETFGCYFYRNLIFR